MTLGTVSGMTIHAAGYDRQSAGRDNRSEASPESQRRNNRAEAQRRADAGTDLVWVGHFSELPGTSAFRSDKERPEFNRLLDCCRAGKVNMVIVDYVSRFSRLEVMDAIPIATELLNLGVVIVSTTEGEFRKGNLMDLIHLIMRLDAAHNESRNKSHAVSDAHKLAKSLGGYVGKVPYGLTLRPETVLTPEGRPVVIRKFEHAKAEAETVRRMWGAIKAHMDAPPPRKGQPSPGSLTGVAASLNANRVPTRGKTSGKKTADSSWDPATVKRILRDPRIAGYRASVVPGTKTYRIERDPVTMRPLTLECGPIIPPDEWHELQRWIDGRGRGKGRYKGGTLLSAMERLFCESGSVMVGHARAGQPKKTAYQCKCKGLRGQHSGTITVNQAALDEHVARRIMALVATAEGDEDTLAVLAEATRRFGKLSEAPEKAGERASLVAERADALRALEELYEDRAAGAYGGPVGRKHFMKAEAAASLRLQGAEERLAELDNAANPVLPIGEWLGEPGADPLGKGSWWDSAGMDERRGLVSLFVKRITVSRATRGRYTAMSERVTVEWVTPEDEDDE